MSEHGDIQQYVRQLSDAGVRYVRLLYADLHGIARGKIIPLAQLTHVVEDGAAFATGIMFTDLHHQYLGAPDPGIPDVRAIPDLDTVVVPSWNTCTAWCLCSLYRYASTDPYELDPRAILTSVIERYRQRGLTPILGPELEFYLLVPTSQGNGYLRYFHALSPVYTTGPLSDPKGFVGTLFGRAEALGLRPKSAFCEFGRGQYEVNLEHGPALDAADRTFLYKTLVKETAAENGFVATFIGKPWNDDEGSGFHLHLSCTDSSGRNAFADPTEDGGLSALGRHFVAGVLNHIHGVMAFLNPTVNAYRRINARGLVPRYANWGLDNRFTLVRIPPERNEATRIEIRIGDGAANPYLAFAAVLAAGLDGIEHELEPPPLVEGFPDDLPEGQRGAPLPTDLHEACASLACDRTLVSLLGQSVIDAYLLLKRSELERFARWVSDWEVMEYVPWL
jgi:glutamine synthetase